MKAKHHEKEKTTNYAQVLCKSRSKFNQRETIFSSIMFYATDRER
jgi:hypothetical protein